MKFTVIIPTRERATTLQHALATVVAQDYVDLTILVSDNASTDNTRAVVESFHDPRIRYVNTGRRVEMTTNWEFALSHVEEGYVGYLGDDDGLLRGAVATASSIIKKYKSHGVSWDKITYGWPNHGVLTYRNQLSIPFTPLVVRQCSRRALARFRKRGPADCQQMFSIYTNGFVDVRLIAEDQNKWKHGRFFRSATPDIFSSCVLTQKMVWFPHSLAPLSIGGSSGNSNGSAGVVAQMGLDSGNSEALDRYLNELTEIPLTTRIDPCLVGAYYYGDALLAANERPDGTIPNERELVRSILRWMAQEIASKPGNIYEEGIDSIRKTAKRYQVEAWAEKLVLAFPHRPQSFANVEQKSAGWHSHRRHISLNGAEFNIRNVADASEFCSHLLGYGQGKELTLEMGSAWRKFLFRAVGFTLGRALAFGSRLVMSSTKTDGTPSVSKQ